MLSIEEITGIVGAAIGISAGAYLWYRWRRQDRDTTQRVRALETRQAEFRTAHEYSPGSIFNAPDHSARELRVVVKEYYQRGGSYAGVIQDETGRGMFNLDTEPIRTGDATLRERQLIELVPRLLDESFAHSSQLVLKGRFNNAYFEVDSLSGSLDGVQHAVSCISDAQYREQAGRAR